MTTKQVVVDHVLFVVGDLAASRRLYTAALAPVGYEELRVQEDGVHYGVEGIDDFAIRFYLGGKIDALGSRMDAAFDQLEARFDSLNARIGSHVGRHAG